jgi:hypothetical protein
LREIEYFFSIYKELQGGKTQMEGWAGPREARKVIIESRNSYLDHQLNLSRSQPAQITAGSIE